MQYLNCQILGPQRTQRPAGDDAVRVNLKQLNVQCRPKHYRDMANVQMDMFWVGASNEGLSEKNGQTAERQNIKHSVSTKYVT